VVTIGFVYVLIGGLTRIVDRYILNIYSLYKDEGGEENMPNLDGTGPQGAGPRTGRGVGNRPLGSSKCTCPKCGHEMSHVRGVPCTEVKCLKCKTPMKGVNCI